MRREFMGSVRSFGISAAMTPKVASLSCAAVDWDRNLQLEEVPPSTFASTPSPGSLALYLCRAKRAHLKGINI